MFTTRTGQTGKDAYVFEATAIANAKRELDDRFRQLRKTVEQEQPELFENSTDFLFSNADSAAHFAAYLQGKEGEFLSTRR